MSQPIDLTVRVRREGVQTLPQVRAELLQLDQAQRALTMSAPAVRSGITGLGNAAEQMGARSLIAGRNVQVLRGALTGLAMEATATRGVVGRLASGLLMFAGGSTVVLGVAAGVAAIALAWRALTRETRETEERIKKLREEIQKFREQKDATLAVRQEIDRLTTQLVAAEARLMAARVQFAAMVRADVGLAAMLGITVTEEQARRSLIAQGWAPRDVLPREGSAAIEVALSRERIQQLSDQLAEIMGKSGRAAGERWLEGLREGIREGTTREIQAIADDLMRRINRGGEAARRRLGPLFLEAMEQLQLGAPRFVSAPRFEPRFPFGLFRQRQEIIQPRLPEIVTPAGAPIGGRPVELGRLGQAGFDRDQIGRDFRRVAITNMAARAEEERTQMLERAQQILTGLQTPQERYNALMDDLRQAHELGAISADQLSEGLRRLDQEMKRAGRGANLAAAHFVTASAQLLAGMISGGGGFGGFLQSVGGFLGLVGGPGLALPAAIVGGLGTVISASDRRGVRVDEYGQRALDQMRDLRAGPDVVSIVITSPTSGEVLRQVDYDLRRRERLDRTERLPPGVSL